MCANSYDARSKSDSRDLLDVCQFVRRSTIERWPRRKRGSATRHRPAPVPRRANPKERQLPGATLPSADRLLRGSWPTNRTRGAALLETTPRDSMGPAQTSVGTLALLISPPVEMVSVFSLACSVAATSIGNVNTNAQRVRHFLTARARQRELLGDCHAPILAFRSLETVEEGPDVRGDGSGDVMVPIADAEDNRLGAGVIAFTPGVRGFARSATSVLLGPVVSRRLA